MKIGRMLLVAGLFTFVGTSAALAGQKIMATGPALGAYPQLQTLYCDIINLNTTPKNVTIETMDYSGLVVTGPLSITLNPNEGQALPDASGQAAWCRFTVDGSTKKYRAVAVYDDGTTYTMAIPAQ